MFENREYNKEYLALVKGHLKNEITIDNPISKSTGSINIKMMCNNQSGKPSITHIKPLKFNEKDNTTLVEATPITGRQHQIRVHLDSIGFPILGDPIYGVDESVANAYLNKTLSTTQRFDLTGAKRLMLHANRLSFTYQDVAYDIASTSSKEIF